MTAPPWTIGIAAVVLVAGCGPAEEPPTADRPEVQVSRDGSESEAGEGDGDGKAADASWVVDFAGYGQVPLGVSLDEANAAAGGLIAAPESVEGCTGARLRGGHEGVWLMVVDGRVVRVDVRNEAVETERGAAIGDTEERIRALYPEGVAVQPHKYTDGHYLIVAPGAGSPYRLIFETDGRAVRNYRAGVLPEVAWVEGCG